MATASPVQKDAPLALPSVARALMSAGKLTQAAAEDVLRKAQANRISFNSELVGSKTIGAPELAQTLSNTFGAPLLDIDAIDPVHLPKDLLDAKLCQAYKVIVLAKRSNRLIAITADPTNQEAAEKIKFTTQLGVDWIVGEYDKLSRLVDITTKSVAESLEGLTSGDFEFDETTVEEEAESQDTACAEVEDAPVVRFLHKMLLDAFNMRASDLHFEPTSTITACAFASTASCRRSPRRRSRSRTSSPRASR